MSVANLHRPANSLAHIFDKRVSRSTSRASRFCERKSAWYPRRCRPKAKNLLSLSPEAPRPSGQHDNRHIAIAHLVRCGAGQIAKVSVHVIRERFAGFTDDAENRVFADA